MQRELKSQIERIPYNEVSFHPHSFGDPDGRLFWWKGELYRGIRSEWVHFYSQLLQDGVIQKLIDRGILIETEPSPLAIEGYEMVVHHRYIPFPAYAHEWCAAMLKDAALTIIELLIELAQHGLTLKDTHPWNVLFDAYKPVYVDFTSIIPKKDDYKWSENNSFYRFCLYPLILMSCGQERIARWLLWDYEGVRKSDVLMLTGDHNLLASIPSVMNRLTSVLRQRSPDPYRELLKKVLKPMQSKFYKQSHSRKFQLEFLEQIRRRVESITLHSLKTEDSDGNSISYASTVKQKCIYRILSDLQPTSVLDLFGNTGQYSKPAALLGSRVVSFNTDPRCSTQLYYDARDKKLPILPLIMDFTRPTPYRGLSNECFISAAGRFKCDMVLALAWAHNAIFKRRLNFDQIVEGLAQFSKRWLVAEFVPREDPDICKLWSDSFSWYTLDNFISALRKWFNVVKIVPSYPEPRVLLLCEK
ncbi:MAG TPA: hypothetical protein VHT73_08305 [Thermodesulfobacteriota bacterium]|nr:hypothetical protein [Thermodesulfobacteriota bacterium]